MATTAEQIRGYRGPAILSFGFRPFFLAGAAWPHWRLAYGFPRSLATSRCRPRSHPLIGTCTRWSMASSRPSLPAFC